MFSTVSIRFFLLLSLLTQLVISCVNSERDQREIQAIDRDLVHYSVTGDEESGIMTVKVQYVEGGIEGMPIEIPGSGTVLLDGTVLPKASTRRSGVYYEVSLPIDAFTGKHVIDINPAEGKKYHEEFEFAPFRLTSEIPDSIHRGEINFNFSGFPAGDSMQLVLMDSSFYSKGIDTVFRVKDGRITLTPKDLYPLTGGPVQVEFYQERQQPGKDGTGIFTFSYAIRRSFYLVD